MRKRQEQDRAHIRLTSGTTIRKRGKPPPSGGGRQQRQRIARRHRRMASQDGSAAQDKRQERQLDNDNDIMTSMRACGGTVDVDVYVDIRNDTPAAVAAATPAAVRMSGTGRRRRGSGHIRDLSDWTGRRSANREMAVCKQCV
jgi:hypothetical protein